MPDGLTVLLIEDDPDVRGVLEKVLAGAGHTVLVAASARAALHLAISYAGEVQLVISDVILPDMTAPELRKAIPLCPEPVWLYISGYGRHMLRDQHIDLPDDALLEKPFSGRVLLAKVASLFAGRHEP